MRLRSQAPLLALAPALASSALALGEPARGFHVPPGLEATVWARSPLFHNPTSLDVDARGRVFVLEAVDYRGFNTRSGKPLWHDAGDRVVVLEDTDGDGAADASHVFVQDSDLLAPLGIAVIGNRVFVSSSPSLIVYTDVDGDARFDPAVDEKETLLTGFGGRDHDHSLHALVAGPDGRYYFPVGNAGPHRVTDRAGFTLRSGSWYAGGSPYNTENAPGLVSDDGRVWVGGLALRMEPDGTGLAVVGHNFRNAMGLAVDSFGDVWQNDNDDEVSCRTTWLMEGGNAGYSSSDGARSWTADRRPRQSTPAAHWRQDDPGVIPAGDVYGPGSPTGMAFYEGDALGPEFRRLLLSCEAGRNVVWGYRPRLDGAGFALERFPFLASVDRDDPEYAWSRVETDERKWFRPSDVVAAPDGAVFVSDWYDPIVGGHQMRDVAGAGVIYRVARAGAAAAQAVAIDPATIDGAVAALMSPAAHVREIGRAALVAAGARALPAVDRLLAGDDESVRARALFVAARIGGDGLARVDRALGDRDPAIRIAALRAARLARHRVPERAARLALDPSPAVRREAALALRDVPFEVRAPSLLALASRYRGGDRFALEAIGAACDGHEEEAYALLAGKLGGRPSEWTDSFADLAWRLHPASAVADLLARASTPSLSLERRLQALDAIAFVPTEAAARAMLDAARSGSEDARAHAAYWVRRRDGDDWRAFGLARSLPGDPPPGALARGAPPPPGAPAFRSDVLRRGAVDVRVDVAGARTIWLVADDAADGNSCDWADWVDARFVGSAPDEPTSADSLPRTYADVSWGEIRAGSNCAGLPMRVDGEEAPRGIGTHASSVIVLDVSGRGFAEFRCRAAVDDGAPDVGGSRHESGRASVRFFVYHDGPSAAERVAALRARLLDPATARADVESIVSTLGLSREGGLALVDLARRGAMPDAAREPAARAALASPDLAVRALASDAFGKAAVEAGALPRGNSERGRALFFGTKAGCSSCHAFMGDGRDVGPDLTAVGGNYDRSALLESIRAPSAAIVTGYESVLLETGDGRLFTGFLAADGATVTIRETTGETRSFRREEIAERRRLDVSLMPDTSALGLSSQDLADLVEFLASPPPR